MKKHILVTGCSGFIGSHVVETLLKQGKDVIGIDRDRNIWAKSNKSRKGFNFFKVDIQTPTMHLGRVFQNYKISKVIHLAAETGVRRSILEPQKYFQSNVLGTINILNFIKKYKIKNVVFASSSSVYGNNPNYPWSEKDELNPISPYALTKKTGEELCKMYSDLYKLNITCLRFFTVYGPRGRVDMAPYKFIDWTYRKIPLTLYGDGTSKRDYTYITDIVKGIIKASNRPSKFEIINLGNSKPVVLNTFISTISKYLKIKPKIDQYPMQLGDVDTTYADIKKAKRLLNWQPKVPFKKGIKKMIDWYKYEEE